MRSTNAKPVPVSRPIVLVGLMGTGKTTIGKRLSARLGLPFADADHEIELAAGMTINEIFERYGEHQFRDGESRVISRLLDGKIKIISTGGGAFMHAATRAKILRDATAIWLDADISVLAERVSRRDTRPLLRGGNTIELLSKLARDRNPVYALAPIHIKSQPVPQDIIVDQILTALAHVS
jgi:shikimate kinase